MCPKAPAPHLPLGPSGHSGQTVGVDEVESEWAETSARSWRGGPLLVQIGGAAFLVLGLVTAVMAYDDADGIAGATTTDRLLVATRPLTLAAVGLVVVAVGMILSHLLDRAERDVP